MLLRALIAIQLSAFITDEHGLCHSLQERCGIIRRYPVTPVTPPHVRTRGIHHYRRTRLMAENYQPKKDAIQELGLGKATQFRPITRTMSGQPDTT